MISEERKNRIKELIERSRSRGIFTFTDFLSPTSISEIAETFKGEKFQEFGGGDFCERKMLRFGDENDFGYSQPFPLSIIQVSLTGGKFATPITHRDVLGAVLNLGIERQKLGDMFINGTFAYIIAHENVAKLILSDLSFIGRNKVACQQISSLPETLAPKKQEREISVSSNRIDSVICKTFNLNREDGRDLCKNGFVTINGKGIEQAGRSLKPNEVVCVRGYGKFVFYKEEGKSKKGKTYIKVQVFC
jgi:RNA-binding protein YlmH